MKRLLTIMLLLSVFSLPSVLWAADPIIGTWKLNISKSKYPPGEKPPKEETETYREMDGGLIDFTYELTQADGTKTLFKATWPAVGGAISTPKGMLPKGITYVETLMGPGVWCVTVMQDGKQVITMHKIVSKDGKMMAQNVTGVDKNGKKFDILRMYDKQ